MIIQFSAEAESDILDGMEFYDQRGLEVGELRHFWRCGFGSRSSR